MIKGKKIIVDNGKIITFETFEREMTKEEKEEYASKSDIEKAKEKLSFGEKKVYKILDTMIDKLYDCGVDVSFFPDRATMVVIETAKKINNKDVNR